MTLMRASYSSSGLLKIPLRRLERNFTDVFSIATSGLPDPGAVPTGLVDVEAHVSVTHGTEPDFSQAARRVTNREDTMYNISAVRGASGRTYVRRPAR